MADEHIERRTFVGETGTIVTDGWAGLRLGQPYELHVTRYDDDTVSIVLEYHAHVTPGAGLVVTVEQFEKWFVK
jgi:hypothetical protein